MKNKAAILAFIGLAACGPNWETKKDPSSPGETPPPPQVTVIVENKTVVVNEFSCEIIVPAPVDETPAPVENDAGTPVADAGVTCTTTCVEWATEYKCDNGWHGEKPQGKSSKEGKGRCRVSSTCVEEVESCQ